MRGTRGTETSKYPQEEKINNDSESSGERKRKSPNQAAMSGVEDISKRWITVAEENWKVPPKSVIDM